MNQIKHKSIVALLLVFMALLALGVSLVSASNKQTSPQSQLAQATAAPTPRRSDAFTFCAYEGGTCTVYTTGASVRFGANGLYVYKPVASWGGSIACTVAAFGSDPVPGTTKECRYITTPATGFVGLTACGTENTTCSFSGMKLVRYGTDTRQIFKLATNGIACTYTAFGNDPASGIPKQCFYMNMVPDASWTQCAVEGGTCTGTALNTVAFGASSYLFKATTAYSIPCTTTYFGGNPIMGTTKYCYKIPEQDSRGWTRCAGEGDTCYFLGTQLVAYGANGSYTYQPATGSINCGVSAFGNDPIYGTVKSCYYKSNAGQ